MKPWLTDIDRLDNLLPPATGGPTVDVYPYEPVSENRVTRRET